MLAKAKSTMPLDGMMRLKSLVYGLSAYIKSVASWYSMTDSGQQRSTDLMSQSIRLMESAFAGLIILEGPCFIRASG